MATNKKITLTKERLQRFVRDDGTLAVSKAAKHLRVSPSKVSTSASELGFKTRTNLASHIMFRDLRVYLRHDNTLNVGAAAKDFEISYHCMLRRAKELGMPIGPPSKRPRTSQLTKKQLKAHVGKDGKLNLSRVMKRYKTSFYTTKKQAKKRGIKTRNRGEHLGLKEPRIKLSKKELKKYVDKFGFLNARLAARELTKSGKQVSHEIIRRRAPNMGFKIRRKTRLQK